MVQTARAVDQVRHGKIKDAIGTHGHMKCLFNGVIQQRDTICATMYKRVYPKFLAA